MAAKRMPQSGTNAGGADSYNPRGHPASSQGPSANMGIPSGGGSPSLNPRNGFVSTKYLDGTGKIGVPTSLRWRWASIGIDSYNVIP